MFNPAKASKNIKDEFIDYISSSFSIADEEYDRLFREQLENSESITKGPLVDINNIFKGGRSISELIDKGILCKSFIDLEKKKPVDNSLYKAKLPLTRPLYVHQEKAIQAITTEHRNAVITTGTGSGKTECFLIPILNDLLKEVEEKTLDPGVRALLIYPMNALANDQMKRLRNILMYYPQITFGVYNGDTEWEQAKAEAKYNDLHSGESCEELRTHLSNELISRTEMNENPPHILCTNYAMLEHMLLRPENDKLFKNSKFKFVVLDEAHIYTGATGMETALLLRRLKARIGAEMNTQFILTSATLGAENKSEADIINFAQNLTGEQFSKEGIVFGKRDETLSSGQIVNVPASVFVELANEDEENVRNVFEKYDIPYSADIDDRANIYNLCKDCSFYRKIRQNVSGPISIDEFSKLLNVTKDEAIAFVHVCSFASQNGKQLIDAKYHFFVRALEGLYAPLYGDKKVFLERKTSTKYKDMDVAVFERTVCSNCGELGIVGKIEGEYLGLAAQYDDKDTKYFRVEHENEEEFEELDEEASDDPINDDEELGIAPKKKAEIKKYYLCPVCGKITEYDDGKPRCECGVEPVIVSEYVNSDGKCSKCQMGHFRRFYIGNEAATGVLATSLFEELPTKQISEYEIDGLLHEYEGGKQFLAFSDSRSEAAFFASFLSKSYKEFLRRRGLVYVLNRDKEDLLDEPMELIELEERLEKLFIRKKAFRESLTDEDRRQIRNSARKNAIMAILTELMYGRRRTSLVSFGLIKFEYKGNDKNTVNKLAEKYAVDKNACKDLLDYLALSIAYFGALKLDDDLDDALDAEDKKYLFYTERQKVVTLDRTKTDRYAMGWKARNMEGKADKFYPNSRVRLVARIINGDEEKANAFLNDYFSYLISNSNKYRMERGNGNFYVMPFNNYQIRIHEDEEAKWYKCDKCGKVITLALDGICPEHNCGGKLHELKSSSLLADNHYLNLYSKEEFTPLLIKEHTAQLSRQEGLEYQTEFEKNKIHALSCSTTFEMGVDVGELETVFLRNVPPTSANYAQRAGRAGRSNNSAAFSLTYAKLSSHDFTYFREPKKTIVGKINPPVFKTDNEKIVLRHINAVILGYFFNHEPVYFNSNKAVEFLENGGYEALVELLDEYPEDLDILLRNSIPDLDKYDWKEKLIGEDGALTMAVKEYKENVTALQKDIDYYYEHKLSREASHAERMKSLYQAKEVIDFMVRNNILPKYGFPIDTVELDVSTDINTKNSLNLSRDLKMAISEYAPGEKVIADNKMYTSRYIRKSFHENKMDFHISYVCECPDCHTWNYSQVDPSIRDGKIKCISCQKEIPGTRWAKSIEPRAGFIAEAHSSEVPMTRPEKLYHSQDSYIGDGKNVGRYGFNVNGIDFIIYSSENDKIMVTSNTKFYVCENCGYSYGIHDVIRKDNNRIDIKNTRALRANAVPFIFTEGSHRNSRGFPCGNKKFSQYYLTHVYSTDVVIIDFMEHNSTSYEKSISALYAILNAMSTELGIDIDDIGGTLSWSEKYGTKGYTLVLYDTVAGGAGHVSRLKNNPDELARVFREAYRRMESCTCDTSCYSCLRSYRNQRLHEVLDRHLAMEFLEPLQGLVIPIELAPVEQEESTESLDIEEDGLSVKDDDYELILDQIDIDELTRLALLNLMTEKEIEKPDFNQCSFNRQSKSGYIDLVWLDKKIALFTSDNEDSYDLASGSDYKCYLVNDQFDVYEFISKLEKE